MNRMRKPIIAASENFNLASSKIVLTSEKSYGWPEEDSKSSDNPDWHVPLED